MLHHYTGLSSIWGLDPVGRPVLFYLCLLVTLCKDIPYLSLVFCIVSVVQGTMNIIVFMCWQFSLTLATLMLSTAARISPACSDWNMALFFPAVCRRPPIIVPSPMTYATFRHPSKSRTCNVSIADGDTIHEQQIADGKPHRQRSRACLYCFSSLQESSLGDCPEHIVWHPSMWSHPTRLDYPSPALPKNAPPAKVSMPATKRHRSGWFNLYFQDQLTNQG